MKAAKLAALEVLSASSTKETKRHVSHAEVRSSALLLQLVKCLVGCFSVWSAVAGAAAIVARVVPPREILSVLRSRLPVIITAGLPQRYRCSASRGAEKNSQLLSLNLHTYQSQLSS